MNVKEQIQKIIEKTIKSIGNFNVPEILVEPPKDKTHGDYFTNVAFELAKVLKKNPYEIALQLKTEIEKDKVIIKKVETVGGFINFFVDNGIFNENIKQILKKKEAFGKSHNLKNQKIIIEYTDPNPFKEFHIGHLMSNAIGESISRIFEFNGAKVKRANYQGDVGLHVAKAIWGKMENANLTWGESYAYGSKMYEEDENTKKRIIELNKKIFERSDKAINKMYDEGKRRSLKYFDELYGRLGTQFDYYFFESQVADFGKKIVEDELKKGIFIHGLSEKADGKEPVVFPGEKFGLHTRVFINSEGLPTYEAKELALAKVKYDTYKYDKSVIITGNEVNEYFKVLMVAMKLIFPELEKKTQHIGHGMMRLPEGKMSSRTGNVITFEYLLKEVEELVSEKLKERDLSKTEKNNIIEKVAIGALKYSILKQSMGSDIVYDFKKSIAFEGDSGPYLQYSLARAFSVLEKAKKERIKPLLKKVPTEISSFVKMMYYFPEVIEKAGKELQPHYIVLYLTELASAFNNYYSQNKIVDIKDEFSPYKVAITNAFVHIMKNGLWLLGINYLEKM